MTHALLHTLIALAPKAVILKMSIFIPVSYFRGIEHWLH